MVRESFQIAIDGPVAAGKSTAAKGVADKLGFLYVDTGAMYRAVALEARKQGIPWDDEEAVTEMVNGLNLELVKPNGDEGDGRLVTVLLDGEDVSLEIRSNEMGEGASQVSAYSGVREVLVAMQQNIAAGESVVMEGRDIGSRVLPKAQMKVFMTADEEERVKRKWEFLREKGFDTPIEQVREDLVKRDERERTREIDPMKPTADAWVFDTTGMSETEVVERIVGKVRELIK